jgi:hypothetical protein
MRIECQSTVSGDVYRVFRSDAPFAERVVALIPKLHQAGLKVIIGPTRKEPDLVFVIGPVYGFIGRNLRDEIWRCLSNEGVTPQIMHPLAPSSERKRSRRR